MKSNPVFLTLYLFLNIDGFPEHIEGKTDANSTFSMNSFSVQCEICPFVTSALRTLIEHSQILHINCSNHTWSPQRSRYTTLPTIHPI